MGVFMIYYHTEFQKEAAEVNYCYKRGR